MKDYALDELARCAGDPNLRLGLKLHFGNSDVDLDNTEHVDRVRRVFRAANGHKMAILVHMRSSGYPKADVWRYRWFILVIQMEKPHG